MQKTGQNASILIWSIFLSIIISLGFISISTGINKALKNNRNIQQEINRSHQIKNILNSTNPTSQQLDDGTYLQIPEKNNYIGSLQENEMKVFSFSGTTLDLIKISVKNGGPIKYKYDIGSVNQEYDILPSGNISFSGSLSNSDTFSTLTIENLGGYTFFQIDSDQDFIAPERFYEIWKKIGNKNVLIQKNQMK